MRIKTPSFTLELPLKTSNSEEKELLSRLESARNIYNAALGESERRATLVKQSKLFQKAKKIPKTSIDCSDIKLKNELFQKARESYDFNENSLHKYACRLRHNLPNNLDIHTVQKLATRAFRVASELLYTNIKIHFKRYNVQDVVVKSPRNDESLKANAMFLSEPAGLKSRRGVSSGEYLFTMFVSSLYTSAWWSFTIMPENTASNFFSVLRMAFLGVSTILILWYIVEKLITEGRVK